VNRGVPERSAGLPAGRRHTGTTLKAHEQEHERVSAHAAMGHIGTGGACEILVRAALAA